MTKMRGGRAHALAGVVGLLCTVSFGREFVKPDVMRPCVAGFGAVLVDGRARAFCGAQAPGGTSPTMPLGARRVLGMAVDLNQLTAQDLEDLSGVGPKLARRIIDARRVRGGFGAVDDLFTIAGVGPARMETLRVALNPAGR